MKANEKMIGVCVALPDGGRGHVAAIESLTSDPLVRVKLDAGAMVVVHWSVCKVIGAGTFQKGAS